jgi:hypothetical protein
MSSIKNTVLLNTESTRSRKRKNRIQEGEEDINLYQFDNDCEAHNKPTSGGNRSRNFKYEEQENKEKRRVKQLEKEYARQNQDPSNRLGKNAKKAAARRALVLNDEIPEEVEIMKDKNAKKLAAWIEQNPETEEIVHAVIGVKSRQIYGRLKRKPGHRGKPELTVLEFEDNELEFPEM